MQLIERAYGRFVPEDDIWQRPDESFVDAFRPGVQPNGFVSEAELLADRRQHLACVRTMFENLDIFVFTLGLTECWRSRRDGTVYPVCPGVDGGVFDPEKYEFFNHEVEDVEADLASFIAALRAVNPKARVILTVSPVPLVATADPAASVLMATTYSKSVLRVAAERVRRTVPDAYYFPSYEIITGSFSRGAYYADDLRNVTEEGVNHVMSLFLKHVSAGDQTDLPEGTGAGTPSAEEQQRANAAAVRHYLAVICDDEQLDSEGR